MSEITKRSSKVTRTSRKQSAEIETKLKALRKQEQTVKKKLSTLECSIVAIPGNHQENRLKQWNTLPPPDEMRRNGRARQMPRVHQARIRQARTQQALTALFLVALLAGFAIWFCCQVQNQHLLE